MTNEQKGPSDTKSSADSAGTTATHEAANKSRPSTRFRPTSTQVIACAAAAALVLTIVQMVLQRQSDRQQEALKVEVKRIGEAALAARDIEIAPQPAVNSPLGFFKMPSADGLFQVAKLTIRNIGRGACYDLCARLTYDSFFKPTLKDGKPAHKVLRDVPIEQLDIVKDLTLAPGDTAPFNIPKYLLFPDMKDPQALTGVVELRCRDRNGKVYHFLQPFGIVVHLEPGNPHAHVFFESPRPIAGVVSTKSLRAPTAN